MRLENIDIVLTHHAYQRYRQRVDPIEFGQLKHQLKKLCLAGVHHKQGYLQTADGIWWRATVQDDAVIFHTCYGYSHMDIPAAARWAKLHGDRIRLGGDVGWQS